MSLQSSVRLKTFVGVHSERGVQKGIQSMVPLDKPMQRDSEVSRKILKEEALAIEFSISGMRSELVPAVN